MPWSTKHSKLPALIYHEINSADVPRETIEFMHKKSGTKKFLVQIFYRDNIESNAFNN
jgi:hypothetical protein